MGRGDDGLSKGEKKGEAGGEAKAGEAGAVGVERRRGLETLLLRLLAGEKDPGEKVAALFSSGEKGGQLAGSSIATHVCSAAAYGQ